MPKKRDQFHSRWRSTTLALLAIASIWLLATVPGSVDASGTVVCSPAAGSTINVGESVTCNPAPGGGHSTGAPATVGFSGLSLSGPFTATSTGGASITYYFFDATGPSALLASTVTATFTVVGTDPSPLPPKVLSLAPASVHQGDGPTEITVSGSGFEPGAQVLFNGNAASTTFIDGSTVKATTDPIFFAGLTLVSVRNPNGDTSNQAALVAGLPLEAPVPAITSISPDHTETNAPGVGIDVFGSGFTAASRAFVNGTEQIPTGFYSSTHLSATIQPGSLASPGILSITVVTPSPGGGTSNAVSFTVADPAPRPIPVITSIAPAVAPAGSNWLTLSVFGTGFTSASRINVNGSAADLSPTNYVSETELHVGLGMPLLAMPATLQVTVYTPPPGGGESSPFALVVEPAAVSSVSCTRPPGTIWLSWGVSCTFIPGPGAGLPTWTLSGFVQDGSTPTTIFVGPTGLGPASITVFWHDDTGDHLLEFAYTVIDPSPPTPAVPVGCTTNSGGDSVTAEPGSSLWGSSGHMPGTVVHCDSPGGTGTWRAINAQMVNDPSATPEGATFILGSEGNPEAATIEYEQNGTGTSISFVLMRVTFGDLWTAGPLESTARRAVANVPPVDGFAGTAASDHFNSRASGGAGTPVHLSSMSGTVFGSNCASYGMGDIPVDAVGPSISGVAIVWRNVASDPAVCEFERQYWVSGGGMGGSFVVRQSALFGFADADEPAAGCFPGANSVIGLGDEVRCMAIAPVLHSGTSWSAPSFAWTTYAAGAWEAWGTAAAEGPAEITASWTGPQGEPYSRSFNYLVGPAGTSAQCSIPSGSTTDYGPINFCDFVPAPGWTFTGWSTSAGWTADDTSSLSTIMRPTLPARTSIPWETPASITARWHDGSGPASTTLNYVLRGPVKCYSSTALDVPNGAEIPIGTNLQCALMGLPWWTQPTWTNSPGLSLTTAPDSYWVMFSVDAPGVHWVRVNWQDVNDPSEPGRDQTLTFTVAAPPPLTAASIAPPSIPTNDWYRELIVTGGGFQQGAKLLIQVGDGNLEVFPSFLGSTELRFALAWNWPPLAPGQYEVKVKNPDGQVSGPLLLTVTEAANPVLERISKSTAPANDIGVIDVIGANLLAGGWVQIEGPQSAGGWLGVLSSTEAKAHFEWAYLPPGDYNLRVYNPGGAGSNALPFTLTPPVVPTLTSISLGEVAAGQNFTLNASASGTLPGTQVEFELQQNPAVKFWAPPLPLGSELLIPAYLGVAGTYNVRLVNPGYIRSEPPLVVRVSPTAAPPTGVSVSPSTVSVLDVTPATLFIATGTDLGQGTMVFVSGSAGGACNLTHLESGAIAFTPCWGSAGPQPGAYQVFFANPGSELTAPITITVAAPVLTPLTHAARVYAGGRFTLAVDDQDRVFQWGGIRVLPTSAPGDWPYQPVPRLVEGVSAPEKIATSYGGAYFLYADGTVTGWGSRPTGGSFWDFMTGEPVALPGPAKDIAVDGHALAALVDGTVWGWGSNSSGALGPENIDATVVDPVQIAGLSGIDAVSAAGGTSMALDVDSGKVWVWGFRFTSTPTELPGVSNAIAISADWNQGSMILRAEGSVLMVQPWGTQPVAIPSPVVQIVATTSFSMALDTAGQVWTWGQNGAGQLGLGPAAPSGTPGPAIPVSGLPPIVHIGAREDQAFAVDENGGIWAWGDGYTGELGDGSTGRRSSPVRVLSGIEGTASCEAVEATGLLFFEPTTWGWCHFFPGSNSEAVTWSTTGALNVSSTSGAHVRVTLDMPPAANDPMPPHIPSGSLIATWNENGLIASREIALGSAGPAICEPAGPSIPWGGYVQCGGYFWAGYLPLIRWEVTGLTPAWEGAWQVTGSGVVSATAHFFANGVERTQRFEYTVTNPSPSVFSVLPHAATVGEGDKEFQLSGHGFVPNSEVRLTWPGGSGAATINNFDPNLLTVTVPSTMFAAAGVLEVTVVNPAPGGGTSDPLPLFVTAAAVPVAAVEAQTTTNAVADVAAAGTGGTTVAAITDSGTGTVAVATYDGNPGNTPSFQVSGASGASVFVDVYVSPGATFTSAIITICDPSGGDVLYWFDGTSWVQVPGVNVTTAIPPATGTCLSFTATGDQSVHPNLADLQGTAFGVGVNRAPSTDPIGGGGAPVPVGAVVTLALPFSDADTADQHTVTWAWGDGSTTTGSVSEALGSGTSMASHTYASAGVFTVTASIGDGHGGAATQVLRYVVVYDPAGGFVTGGGWFESPAEAYTPIPSLVGRATFGFVSRYEKGSTVPTGNTQFQFQAGNLNFKSISYEWLVVAGSKAQFRGVGTINGQGSYAFFVTAIDGDSDGAKKPDRFRIRIWDRGDGGLVYDNQNNAPDDADPTTVLGGGSIVVHK